MRTNRLTSAELTQAQLRRALTLGATPGISGATGPDKVFLYRERPQVTDRWLVDRHGHVLAATRFSKGERQTRLIPSRAVIHRHRPTHLGARS
jgi:hypothetical protein